MVLLSHPFSPAPKSALGCKHFVFFNERTLGVRPVADNWAYACWGIEANTLVWSLESRVRPSFSRDSMRGFARHTLSEGACDVWLGVASGVDRVATTRPYYRSTYVFVTRADQRLKGLTLDDPRLKSLKIGVQMVGKNSARAVEGLFSRRCKAYSRKGWRIFHGRPTGFVVNIPTA